MGPFISKLARMGLATWQSSSTTLELMPIRRGLFFRSPARKRRRFRRAILARFILMTRLRSAMSAEVRRWRSRPSIQYAGRSSIYFRQDADGKPGLKRSETLSALPSGRFDAGSAWHFHRISVPEFRRSARAVEGHHYRSPNTFRGSVGRMVRQRRARANSATAPTQSRPTQPRPKICRSW